MKKVVFVALICLCFVCDKSLAQTFPVIVNSSSPVSSNISSARYEFVQSELTPSYAFLVDKFTGKVWRYKIGGKKFEEIKRAETDSVDVNQVNYQLYMSGNNASMCFLLNIHTGHLWRYASQDGEKIFYKMSMPWDSPK